MLVIKPRGGNSGMGRYNAAGSGIFDSISRKMFASGLKKAISTGARSVVAQKVADAVVNGSTSASQKAAESIINEAINTVKPIVKNSLKKLVTGQKRSSAAEAVFPVPIVIPTTLQEGVANKKKRKPDIDINSLINGSGIVFD